MYSDSWKAIPNCDISINILKSIIDIHLSYIINVINLSEGYFPDGLKLAEVSTLS